MEREYTETEDCIWLVCQEPLRERNSKSRESDRSGARASGIELAQVLEEHAILMMDDIQVLLGPKKCDYGDKQSCEAELRCQNGPCVLHILFKCKVSFCE